MREIMDLRTTEHTFAMAKWKTRNSDLVIIE